MVKELDRLAEAARAYGRGAAAEKLALLGTLERRALPGAEEVARLHEVLCWLRAYPDDAAVLTRVERMLSRFSLRADLRRQRKALADSGIAGTVTQYRFFWPVALWLTRRWPDRLHLAWDEAGTDESVGRALPRLGLGRRERSGRRTIDRLRGRKTEAQFLVEQIAALGTSSFEREALHDAIDSCYRLEPGPDTPTRTAARRPRSRTVFRRAPPDRTRPALAREMRRKPRAVRALSRAEGQRVIDLALGAMVTRSRDLEAFGYGDPRDVRIVQDGAGLEFALIGVLPERRFLLHATYGILTLVSGVPIGYAQADALLGSIGFSYNTFETFRGGEAARVLGRLIATLHQVFGARSFSIEPYQLGQGNEEGLSSGAWWFYYKLGFRPRDREVQHVAARELARMEREPGHRSSRATLSRLARAHLFFEGRNAPRIPPPPWKSGVEISGDHPLEVEREAARLLGVRTQAGWSREERRAFARWAPLVLRLRGVEGWSAAERRVAVRVIRAKGGRRESEFVVRLDAHARLGRALLAQERSAWTEEVIRRGLHLPKESTDRESLREAYRRASKATRASLSAELGEIDHLAAEGLDEW